MKACQKESKIDPKKIEELRGQLLKWYDAHRRNLPWRAPSGQKPDFYHVWLSEIMLQQTTVAAVKAYFEKFTRKWPTIDDLAAADREEVMQEWAGLGYYARARNLHKCAQVVVNDLNGKLPQDQKELLKLPGIGDYTSGAIRTIAFNKPATVMDGNIERVMARLFAIQDPLPKSKPQLKEKAHLFFDNYNDRPGDLAQAMMDLGAGICTPKSPKCMLCPIREGCKAYALGIAEQLPKKNRQKTKPQKIGSVFWIENQAGEILIHTRPEKGLLGGMKALPTSRWVKNTKRYKPENPEEIPLREGAYEPLSKSVFHSFTHFDLELKLIKSVWNNAPPERFQWHKPQSLEKIGFPTVFEKAYKLLK